jgi:hypothetical protein
MAKIEIEILIFSSYAIGYAPPILETSIKEWTYNTSCDFI